MDKAEEKLQREKIDLIRKMVALLEEIAWHTAPGLSEKQTYLERLYASSKR